MRTTKVITSFKIKYSNICTWHQPGLCTWFTFSSDHILYKLHFSKQKLPPCVARDHTAGWHPVLLVVLWIFSQYCHIILSPCIVTLNYHPVLSPCIVTRYCHPVFSPCIVTPYYHPVLSPCIFTLYYHPVLSLCIAPCIVTLYCHPVL